MFVTKKPSLYGAALNVFKRNVEIGGRDMTLEGFVILLHTSLTKKDEPLGAQTLEDLQGLFRGFRWELEEVAEIIRSEISEGKISENDKIAVEYFDAMKQFQEVYYLILGLEDGDLQRLSRDQLLDLYEGVFHLVNNVTAAFLDEGRHYHDAFTNRIPSQLRAISQAIPDSMKPSTLF